MGDRTASRDLHIRVASAADVTQLARLDGEIFGDEAYHPVTWRQLLDVSGPMAAVATMAGDLVGYSVVTRSWEAARGWFVVLGVVASLRGKGVGRSLVARAVADSWACGLDELRLTVDPDNAAAVRLYRSVGFTVSDTVPDYFGPGHDRLVMSLVRG